MCTSCRHDSNMLIIFAYTFCRHGSKTVIVFACTYCRHGSNMFILSARAHCRHGSNMIILSACTRCRLGTNTFVVFTCLSWLHVCAGVSWSGDWQFQKQPDQGKAMLACCLAVPSLVQCQSWSNNKQALLVVACRCAWSWMLPIWLRLSSLLLSASGAWILAITTQPAPLYS